MAILNRGAVFAAAPVTKEIEVPEWGGSILLRAETPRSRTLLLDAIAVNEDAVQAYERDQALDEDERQGLEKVERFDGGVMRIIFSAVDEQGDLVFTPDDHDRFRDLGYATLIMILTAINDVNDVKAPSFAAKKKPSA